MDSLPADSPDLHMPPPSMGQDSSISGTGQEGTLKAQSSFSDTSDTVLVDPHGGSSPKIAHTSSSSGTVQDDIGGVVAGDDDDSVLDEEWIQKAKTIVSQNRGDPYQQSREISKVKANYLKAHYNKDIKIADDQSL